MGRYTLRAPNAVDVEFRATPWSRAPFGPRGHAVFFFANPLNDVEDPALHFRGIEEDCMAEDGAWRRELQAWG